MLGTMADSDNKKGAAADNPTASNKGSKEESDEIAMKFDENSPLVSLPPDALTSVLCRVPSAHHGALWKTCKIVREAIDSEAYCSERSASGWAEVSTRLVPGKELWEEDNLGDGVDPDSEDYEAECARKQREQEESLRTYYSRLGRFDETYRWHNIETEVKVDGRPAGKIELALIPRRSYEAEFHEATDAHSAELQEVGWSLCDSRGRPKVRSIKDADEDGSAKRGGFLHVVSVRIGQPYRSSGNTNVVSKALRMAVAAPELSGKWTLATAIADANVYFSKEDKKLKEELSRDAFRNRLGRGGSSGTSTGTQESREDTEKELDKRWKECSKLDARTFCRVGYKQIPEAVGVEKGRPVWLFALPRFFADNDILSHEDALEIPLDESPDLPPEPKGADKELLEIMMRTCTDRRALLDMMAKLNHKKMQQEQQLSYNERQQELMIERLDDAVGRSIASATRLLEENRSQLSQERVAEVEAIVNENRAEVDALRGDIEQKREQSREQIRTLRSKLEEQEAETNQHLDEALKSMDEIDLKLKEDVSSLVADKSASIRKSFALHCVARHRISAYIDLLLELLPPGERADAINDLDLNGCSPLHCAVMGMPELSQADEQHRFVEELVSLGADKDIVSPATGTTALGQYRSSVSSKDDFIHALLSAHIREERGDTEEAWQPIHERMEEALMPVRGETDADRDAKRPADAHTSSSGVDIFDNFAYDDYEEEDDYLY